MYVCMHVCTKSFLKTTTNSSCVCTHLANKADSDLILILIYRMGVRLLLFICWIQFWDYEYLMYTLHILLLNVTGLNSAVKQTCVLEYLHRKSISGALISNTASSGIFSPCVLGVSCGHGSVDACRPGFVFFTADWLLCWYKCVSSWSLMQRRRLFAGFAAAKRGWWCRTGVSRTCVERHIGLHIIITLFLFFFFFFFFF